MITSTWQLFRKNHAGGPFMIQPEKMAQQVYSGTTWTIKNYREARDVLLREGFIAIHERHPRSRIKATKYALAVRPLTDADRRLSLDVLKHIGSAMKIKAAPAQSKKGASAGGASSPDALKSMQDGAAQAIRKAWPIHGAPLPAGDRGLSTAKSPVWIACAMLGNRATSKP